MTTGRRQELVEFLTALGATSEQLVEAEAAGRLHSLAADLVLARGCDLSATDLAERLGVSTPEVLHVWRALGVEVHDDKEPLFSQDDADFVGGLLSLEHFRHDDEGEELLRVIGASLGRVAEAAVAAYVQSHDHGPPGREESDLQGAKDNAGVAAVALQVGGGLGTVFTHHLRDAISRQRQAQSQVTDRALFRIAVGFVDLVGFTPLSRLMGPLELRSLVNRFEGRAFDVASEHGGRIVKHIGDEIMFITLDPEDGCRLALALMDEFDDDRIQPRGGLSFGEVLTRHGDYYGPVVNLAARLADEAVPGEVLVDDSVCEASRGGALSFDPAGRRQLRGFDSPVRVFSVLGQGGPVPS